MSRCLHNPVKGYYARNIRGIGSRGDFTTAPQLSDAPAAAIAAWAARALRETGCRDLLEIGPGLGTLSKEVFRRLPLTLRLRTRLHLIESSPALATRQMDLLKNRADYHSAIHSALDACRGNAVIYSNELVDAFPVRLFEKKEDEWREVALDSEDSRMKEVLLPFAKLPPSSIFTQNLAAGQRIEVHESYRFWLESWLPSWKNGEMLTIDYGDTAERLYHRRPRGSIRAFLLHQRIEGGAVYANPGLQDITADVNFTDLAKWAAPWARTIGIDSFADFIRPFGSPQDSPTMDAAQYFLTIRQRPATKNL